MKPPFLLLVCAGLALAACAAHPARQPVTPAAARTAPTQASAASNASVQASQRSSEQIRAFRNDASAIDYKAQRALDILNGDGHP